jgi:hypothetical protein
MSQITLYLDPETAAKMKVAAESAGISQSQWVARIIRKHFSETWPESVKELTGAWPEFPSAEELRQSHGEDAVREFL